jgi:small conductance mechanosensitive channel
MNTIQTWLASVGLNALDHVFDALILLCAGILFIRLAIGITRKLLNKSRLEKAAHSLIEHLLRAVLYLLLGLMVADKLGIDVTGVIALASVLTLAVSLSVQNMLTNVLGGFTLLTTHPFKSGDYVEVAGKSGTVEEITMTYTKLTTPDQKVISIPNSSVVSSDIINYSVSGTRRVDFAVRAAYTENAQTVIDALVVAGTVDKVLLDPAPCAYVANFGEGAVEYTLRLWTKTEDYWDVFFAVNQNIKNTFDAQGIKVGFPHMHVYMEQ